MRRVCGIGRPGLDRTASRRCRYWLPGPGPGVSLRSSPAARHGRPVRPAGQGSRDQRPWLGHGLWPPGGAPLLAGSDSAPAASGNLPADYPFVRVEGDGVHEIAVGPVHAGIIEPGHFRFSVVGEKVLRLEPHLGYVHKGIERRFTELPPLEAHRLAGRVSGDSTVAYRMGLLYGAGIGLAGRGSGARPVAARADARTRAGGQSPGRSGRLGQRCSPVLRAGAVFAPA